MKRVIPKGIAVKITIYGLGDLARHAEEVIYYQYNLPMWIVDQWRWYFEYLAALVKVHNPKRHVKLYIGPQNILAGQDWVNYKTKTLLTYRRGLLKKIQSTPIADDLFGLSKAKTEEKIKRIKSDIAALERGEINFYIFPTYTNKIKKWINRKIN